MLEWQDVLNYNGAACAVYLLYSYKITNTGAEACATEWHDVLNYNGAANRQQVK